MTELFEGLGGLAKKMGSTAPVIEALSASFALMNDANARSEYDEIRRLLVGYLESLDGSDVERPAGAKPALEVSPDVSTQELVAFVDALRKKRGGGSPR
jgi:hypothetical protein